MLSTISLIGIYFPKWQLPKPMCKFRSGHFPRMFQPQHSAPYPILDAALGPLSHPRRSTRPLLQPNLIFGKLPLGKLNIWEVATLYFHRPMECLVKTPDLKRQFSLISPSNRKLSPNLVVLLLLWRIYSAFKQNIIPQRWRKSLVLRQRGLFHSEFLLNRKLSGNDPGTLGTHFSFLT